MEFEGGPALCVKGLVAWSVEAVLEDKTEENIKALQSVGQIIGEVLKQLDDERCEYLILDMLGICNTNQTYDLTSSK